MPEAEKENGSGYMRSRERGGEEMLQHQSRYFPSSPQETTHTGVREKCEEEGVVKRNCSGLTAIH